MKKTQWIDLFRNIKKTKVSFISVAVFVMLSVTVFTGLSWTGPALDRGVNQLFRENNMFDAEIVYPYGLSQEDIEEIKALPNVDEAEGIYVAYQMLYLNGQRHHAKITSLTERVNKPYNIQGKLPTEKNEIAIETLCANKNNIKIGDVFTLVQDDDGKAHILKDVIDKNLDELKGAGTKTEDGTKYFVENTFTVTALFQAPEHLSGVAAAYGSSFTTSIPVELVLYVSEAAFDHDAFGGYPMVVVKDNEIQKYDNKDPEYVTGLERLKESLNGYLTEFSKKKNAQIRENADELFANIEAEIEEKRVELEAAEKKLQDAKQQLIDGEKQLQDAKKQLEDAEKLLRDAEKQLAEGKATLDEKRAQLDAGWAQYNDGIKKLEDGKKEYEEKKALYDKAMPIYEKACEIFEDFKALSLPELVWSKVEPIYNKIPDTEEWAEIRAFIKAIPTEAQALQEYKDHIVDWMEEKKATVDKVVKDAEAKMADAEKQIADGEKQAEDAKKQLTDFEKQWQDGQKLYNEKEQEYNNGKQQYEDGTKLFAEKTKEYEDGKKLVEENEPKVIDARKQFDGKQQEFENAKRQFNDAFQDANAMIIDRKSDAAYGSIAMILDILGRMRWSIALLFVIIGVLVCFSAVQRIVNEQVVLLGTKKALGLMNREITISYILYAGFAALIGVVIGTILGMTALEAFMLTFLARSFTFTFTGFYISGLEAAIVGGLELVVTIFAALLACYRVLKKSALKLLQGNDTAVGKPHFYQKGALWNRLPLLTKTIINNAVNDKRRVIGTLIGILGCTALVVSAFTFFNNISRSMADHYARIQKYKTVVYVDREVANAEENVSRVFEDAGLNYARVESILGTTDGRDGGKYICYVLVAQDEKLYDQLKLISKTDKKEHKAENGVWVSYSYAREFSLKPGDKVPFTESNGTRHEFTVEGVYENYLTRVQFVMTPETFEESFHKQAETNALFVEKEMKEMEDVIAKLPSVEGYACTDDFYNNSADVYKQSSNISYAVIGIYILLSVIMAALVNLNLLVMFVEEKKKELIVMMINGFSVKDARRYIYSDTILLTVIGIILGSLLGTVMGSVMTGSVESMMTSFIREPSILAYVVGAAITAVLMTVMSIIALKRVSKFKMVDINK